jgi:Protein of unknown function (DUF3102)
MKKRGRKEHAARINDAWQKTVDSAIETGLRIIDAREGLEHGEYIAMIESDLNFSRSMAFRFVAIASDKVLSNDAHVQHLPPAVGTLYDLTVIANKGYDLEAGIQSGDIHPKMERKDVKALLPPPQRDDDLEETEPDPEEEAAVEDMPTEEEAEASYQHNLFDLACQHLEEMTDETRQKLLAHIRDKYGLKLATQTVEPTAKVDANQDAAPTVPPKKRGRPKGSKNRPKAESTVVDTAGAPPQEVAVEPITTVNADPITTPLASNDPGPIPDWLRRTA